MSKISFLVLFSFITNLNILNAFAEKNQKKVNEIPTNQLTWNESDTNDANNLYWFEVDEIDNNHKKIKNLITNKKNNSNFLSVRSTGKGVSVNGFYYSDISNYVPNAFVEDPNKLFGLSLRGISKTRFCKGKNFSQSCGDGVLDLDFKLFNNNKISIYPKINLQSLSNRGTDFGEGFSLGMKFAKEFSPKLSVAIGGENIAHFDDSIDLGRNFYIVASTYLPLTPSNKSNILFLTAGLGSDFYGYKGNGFLFRTSCLGNNTLTGTLDNPSSCSWGPIASAALSLNNRFSIVGEWFGYSYGAGFALRPFQESNLSISLFATDFIKGFPKYAENYCANNVCETRFYGNISLHF